MVMELAVAVAVAAVEFASVFILLVNLPLLSHPLIVRSLF